MIITSPTVCLQTSEIDIVSYKRWQRKRLHVYQTDFIPHLKLYLKYAECSIRTSLWHGISVSSHLITVSNSPYKCSLAASISCSLLSLLALAPMILEQVSKSLLMVMFRGQGDVPWPGSRSWWLWCSVVMLTTVSPAQLRPSTVTTAPVSALWPQLQPGSDTHDTAAQLTLTERGKLGVTTLKLDVLRWNLIRMHHGACC